MKFLKEKSEVVAEILTRNHRKIVQQFIDHKKQTKEAIEAFDEKAKEYM